MTSNIRHLLDRDTALGLSLILHDVGAAKDAVHYGRNRVPTWPEIVRVKPTLFSETVGQR